MGGQKAGGVLEQCLGWRSGHTAVIDSLGVPPSKRSPPISVPESDESDRRWGKGLGHHPVGVDKVMGNSGPLKAPTLGRVNVIWKIVL